jgi:hypothetical protein
MNLKAKLFLPPKYKGKTIPASMEAYEVQWQNYFLFLWKLTKYKDKTISVFVKPTKSK